MKLDTKKQLAAKALEVGKRKIIFDESRLSEIKEAITKQDIRDLAASGAVRLRETKGRKKKKRKKTKRGAGKIRMNVKKRKRQYVLLTRKLRAYAQYLKIKEKISKEEYKEIRKKIRARYFKSKAQLKDYVESE